MATSGNIKHWEVGAAGKGSRQRQCDRESISKFDKNHISIFGENHKPTSGKWKQIDGKLVEVDKMGRPLNQPNDNNL